MGGTRDDDTINYGRSLDSTYATEGFDAVVTLYAWANPMSWGVEELRFGFGDGTMDHVDVNRVLETAKWALARWAEGKRVLIRCQAGLNRSGLITALVLMLAGHSAEEAIILIREQRCEVALCNGNFVDWLLSSEAQALVEGLRGSSAA